MIPLMKSAFHDEPATRMALARFLLGKGQLSMGPECAAFESLFSAWQGRRHSVFVSSGSAANLILIQAMLNCGRLHKGDKVGFSALTWATNAMPLIQLGLDPVPVDVELETLNVSARTLAAAGSMKALFITNALGLCDDLPAIARYCREQCTELLEDNCEALGSTIKGGKLGNWGGASTFSFFVGHHLSTIEGGMVCCDDDDLADTLRMTRAHGWDRNLTRRDKSFYGPYKFYCPAYNARPMELQAVCGKVGLESIDATIRQRDDNFRAWRGLCGRKVYPMRYKHMDIVSSFALPLVFREDADFLAAIEHFEKAGVQIRPIIAGDITEQPFYRNSSCRKGDTRNAALIGKQGFYFTNRPDLTATELTTIVALLMAHT